MKTQRVCYISNLHRNWKAKEDRLYFPSASGPLSPAQLLAAARQSWWLLCSRRITVAAGTIESRRGSTPCPWNLKMSSHTPEYTHFLPVFNRKDVLAGVCVCVCVCGYEECVQSLLVWVFVVVRVETETQAKKHTWVCVCVCVNVAVLSSDYKSKTQK